MIFPDYTITSKTLQNISYTEYARAVIENTTILPAWEKQLQKEAITNTIYFSLKLQGINIKLESVKKTTDKLIAPPLQELANIQKALKTAEEFFENKKIQEEDLKKLHKVLSHEITAKTKQGVYRNVKTAGKTDPEEILAELTQVLDWHNNEHLEEEHPLIKTSLLAGYLHKIMPFENLNDIVTGLTADISLKQNNYGFNNYLDITKHFFSTGREFQIQIKLLGSKDPDFTKWIEYYSECLAVESHNVMEKVLLLAKDTKVAKASGRVQLSSRQEKIVAFLQDYGQLQNRDFERLFPGKSEDTVLRDLKDLIDRNIIVKRGSTKSSRYVLK